MVLTCATCGLKFSTIGEIADHISKTYKGYQGDIHANDNSVYGIDEKDDIQQSIDAVRGFAHLQYYDKNGNLIPSHLTELSVPNIMAGARRCISCNTTFSNNYRLYKHCTELNHGHQAQIKIAIEEMKRFEEFENKWF